jgi:hypothetical protein
MSFNKLVAAILFLGLGSAHAQERIVGGGIIAPMAQSWFATGMKTPVFATLVLPSSGTTTPQFSPVVGGQSITTSATANTRTIPVPVAGKIGGLYAAMRNAQVTANVNASVNGISKSLGCSFTAAIAPYACSDSINHETVSAGDLIGWRFTLTGGAAWAQPAALGVPVSFLFQAAGGQQLGFLAAGPSNAGISTTTAYFMGFGGVNLSGLSGTDLAASSLVPTPGQAQALYVTTNGVENANPHTFTIYKNGVATAMACTPAASGTGCCVNLTGTGTTGAPGAQTACGATAPISLAVGDTISVNVACPGANCGTIFPGISVLWAPTTAGQALLTTQLSPGVGNPYWAMQDVQVSGTQINSVQLVPQLGTSILTLSNLLACIKTNPGGTASRQYTFQVGADFATAPTAPTGGPKAIVNVANGACTGANSAVLLGGNQDNVGVWAPTPGQSVVTSEADVNSPAGGVQSMKLAYVATVTEPAPPIPPVVNGPSNVRIPVIVGVDTQGSILALDKGDWTGDPTITYTYTWRAIGGGTLGTANTLLLTSGMLGNWIVLDVTATNAAGTQTVSSDSVGPVATALPPYPYVGATDGAGHSLAPTSLPTYPGHMAENGFWLYPGCFYPPPAPTATGAHVWYIDPDTGATLDGGASGHAGSPFKDVQAIFTATTGYTGSPLWPNVVVPGDTIYVKAKGDGSSMGVVSASNIYSTSDKTTNGTPIWTWILRDPASVKAPVFTQVRVAGGAAWVWDGLNAENNPINNGSTSALQGPEMVWVSGNAANPVHDMFFRNLGVNGRIGHSNDPFSVDYPTGDGHSDGTIQTASGYMRYTQDPPDIGPISATLADPTKLFIQGSMPTNILNGPSAAPPMNFVWSPAYFRQQIWNGSTWVSGVPNSTGIPNGTVFKDVQGMPGVIPQGNASQATILAKAVVLNQGWFATDTKHMWVGVNVAGTPTWVDEGLGYLTIGTCVAGTDPGCPTTNTNNGTPFVGCDPIVNANTNNPPTGGCGGNGTPGAGTWPLWNGVTRNMTNEYPVLTPGMVIPPTGWWNGLDWTYHSNAGVRFSGAGGSNNLDPPNPNDTVGAVCLSLANSVIRNTGIGLQTSLLSNAMLYGNRIVYRTVDGIEVYSDHRVIANRNLVTNSVYGIGHNDFLQWATVQGATQTIHYFGNVAINNEGYTWIDPNNQFPVSTQGFDVTDLIYDGTYLGNNISINSMVNNTGTAGQFNVMVHNDVLHDDNASGIAEVISGNKAQGGLPANSMLANNISNAMNRPQLGGANSTASDCTKDLNTVQGNVTLPVINASTGAVNIQNSTWCGQPNVFLGISNGIYAGLYSDMMSWSAVDYRTEVPGVAPLFLEYHPVNGASTGFLYPGGQPSFCIRNWFKIGSCPDGLGILNLRPDPTFVGTDMSGLSPSNSYANFISSGATHIPNTPTSVGQKVIQGSPSMNCGGGIGACGGSGGKFVTYSTPYFPSGSPSGLYTAVSTTPSNMSSWGVTAQFTITGSGFGATPGTVTIQGSTANTISSWSDTQITGTLPASPAQGINFTLSSAGAFGSVGGQAKVQIGGVSTVIHTWNSNTIAGAMPPNAPFPTNANTVVTLSSGATTPFTSATLNTSVSSGTIASASITGFTPNAAPFVPAIIGAGINLGAQAPPADHGNNAWANPPAAGAYQQ